MLFLAGLFSGGLMMVSSLIAAIIVLLAILTVMACVMAGVIEPLLGRELGFIECIVGGFVIGFVYDVLRRISVAFKHGL